MKTKLIIIVIIIIFSNNLLFSLANAASDNTNTLNVLVHFHHEDQFIDICYLFAIF